VRFDTLIFETRKIIIIIIIIIDRVSCWTRSRLVFSISEVIML